jgi:hypothetical protein
MRFFALIVAALGLSAPASAFTFAEGYSSAEPGAPALLYIRAFTLTEGRESCDTGPRATSLRLRLPSTTLKVGDRIHRMNTNPATRMDLIIEARDGTGALVPGVPIVVDVIPENAGDAGNEPFTSTSDLDYLEATAPGKFTLQAQIYCDYGTISTRLSLTIEE